MKVEELKQNKPKTWLNETNLELEGRKWDLTKEYKQCIAISLKQHFGINLEVLVFAGAV